MLMNPTRAMITLPDPVNLGMLPDDMYLRSHFIELTGFSECVHLLSLSKWSPYQAEAQAFTEHAHLYALMSGLIPSSGAFKNVPRLYNLCRLTVLLYIHAVFLEYHHCPVTLTSELAKIRRNMTRIQILERQITLENLALMIFKNGDRNAMENTDRTLQVLRLCTISKKLSIASLENMLSLFYGYLMGQKFDEDARALFWDVDEMEKEAFGTP
jgi:hypothetical protein